MFYNGGHYSISENLDFPGVYFSNDNAINIGSVLRKIITADILTSYDKREIDLLDFPASEEVWLFHSNQNWLINYASSNSQVNQDCFLSHISIIFCLHTWIFNKKLKLNAEINLIRHQFNWFQLFVQLLAKLIFLRLDGVYLNKLDSFSPTVMDHGNQ